MTQQLLYQRSEELCLFTCQNEVRRSAQSHYDEDHDEAQQHQNQQQQQQTTQKQQWRGVINNSGGLFRWMALSLACYLLLMTPNSVQAVTVRDLIMKETSISEFAAACTLLGLLDGLFDSEANGVNFTVFAPTNDALQKSALFQLYSLGSADSNEMQWMDQFNRTIRNHIIPGHFLTQEQVFADVHVMTTIDNNNITINNFLKRIEMSQIVTPDLGVSENSVNGYLHIIDHIIEPAWYDNLLSDLELTPEYGPDYLERTSLVDIYDFVDARDLLERIRDSGMTSMGCRIRAFNRINDYYKQMINNPLTESIIVSEWLNESFKNETITQFLEYNILDFNLYYEDIPYGHEELVFPANKCAHMWVTKMKGRDLCFNNGCIVKAPIPETFLASNGVGYVIDKCVVCPGIAMLVTFASDFTTSYNMLDASQFFISSEWNLRNLSLTVGNGEPITLFAADNIGWFELHADDHTRLSTDEWKPHQWDFLRHMMIQGNYTVAELEALYEEKGGDFNLTSLAGQDLLLSKSENGNLTIAGGQFILEDIHGIDGMVHFTDKLPLVRSVTHSVYEIAKWMGTYTEQVNLIDSVFLYEDMNRLLPLTCYYAPDATWKNKLLQVEEIEHVLENHIMQFLLWCDDLMTIHQDKEMESLNSESWMVTKNADGMPCFDTPEDSGTARMRVCVTECDILARNGLVHEVNTVMMQTKLPTRKPSPPIPPSFQAPVQPVGNEAARFPTAKAAAIAPVMPISFSRPKREYTDDQVDDDDKTDEDTDDIWSGGDSSRKTAATAAAFLPILAALLG